MEAPVKSPEEKNGESSTEDVEDLGSISGGRMKLKILVKTTEVPGGGVHLNHSYFRGMLMHRSPATSSDGPPTKSPRYILDSPAAEAQSTEDREEEEEKEVDWSSLPVLPLLMIMDRLDVFDNRRLTAVCRDWWSTAMQYPKNLYSIGDGVPWLWHVKKHGKGSPSREFISVLGIRKLEVDMPEFAHSRVLFSKGGWILLHQNRHLCYGSWFLVNPLTRDRIELPKRQQGNKARCYGSFSLRDSDGYPDRVVLIIPELPFQASIHTARPGVEEVWTSHDYTGLKRTFLNIIFTHVLVGDNVYCLDPKSYMTVFNVANNSVKELPRIPSGGFMAEHEGELIYVEYGESILKKYKSFVLVHEYRDASSSWKRLSLKAVMGTNWCLYRGGQNTVSVKGKGLKIHRLILNIQRLQPGSRLKYICFYVRVTDLLTGKERTMRVPFPDHTLSLRWVAMG